MHILKHCLRYRFRPQNDPEYAFKTRSDIPVTHVRTRTDLVFWLPQQDLRGKASSASHAAGLQWGYRQIAKDSSFVLLLDQDIVFLKHNWTEDFLEKFADPDVMLVGAFREEKIYERPFLRPFCLMLRNEFFSGHPNIFNPTQTGDTGSFLTYFCEDQGKKWYLFDNSLNNPRLKSMAGLKGDIAVDETGEVMCSHCGSGTAYRITAEQWIKDMSGRLECLS